MRVTILGSGCSGGTPQPGQGWGKCDPNNPKNRRLRPSILVENEGTTVLVDTSPDLREQLLDADVTRLDAVVYTHAHADHLHGIDDLRGINRAMGTAIDAYADEITLGIIQQRFGYVLKPLPETATSIFKPTLVPHVLNDRQSVDIGNLKFSGFVQDHGFSQTMGYRINNVGYTTDVVELPEHAFDILAGIDTWIIGTFIDRPHATHVDVDRALGWIERVKPKRGIFTHLGQSLDHDQLAAYLPNGVEPAYDGMVIDTA